MLFLITHLYEIIIFYRNKNAIFIEKCDKFIVYIYQKRISGKTIPSQFSYPHLISL